MSIKTERLDLKLNLKLTAVPMVFAADNESGWAGCGLAGLGLCAYAPSYRAAGLIKWKNAESDN
jgi:hypothetical protein